MNTKIEESTMNTPTDTAPADGPKRKVRKVTKTAKSAKPDKENKATPSNVTPLKSICSKLRIDPRTARRVLRSQGFEWHGHRSRWDMTPKQIEKATAALKEHVSA